jgi:excinuclease ABC subunit C
MQRPDLAPQLKALPTRPGVYRFYDAEGEILYVGKAVNLRNRVRSYFHDSANHAPKVRKLVEKVANLEWIVTGSDLEALLLEMNLIKEHRPYYNVLLKDDKRYPYIKVTWADPFPKVYATRKVLRDGSRYYGPYTSAAAMYETLNALRKVFPFLDCNRTITGKDPRACLYHDMGLCLAPCIGAVDQAGYRAMLERLGKFLEGDTEPVMKGLRAQMDEHAERLEFEAAAKVRDRILAIQTVVERQRIIAPSLSDQDVIALARDDGSAVAQVFFVRNGKLIGREYFQLDNAEGEDDADVIASFLKQFYDDTALVPGEIVVPQHIAESEIIERWLGDKRGTRVKITVPQRGHKRDLVNVAVENAAETMRALKVAHAVESGGERATEAMESLAAALDLPRMPRRIECYDISNLQGTHTVGAMVVFTDAVPARADYRHFRIKTVAGQDDFASMREMLSRRFERLARARAAQAEGALPLPPEAEPGSRPGQPDAGSFEKTPDLVLIDGGKGQLGVAVDVLQSLGLDDLPVAALAKRHEELFQPGRALSVYLPRDSQALFLVQRVRDETHRFAITYNRKLRQKAGLRSTLDEIPGIGGKRRKALLVHFGSLDGVRAASVDQLAAVPGMSRRAAEQVKAYL